MNAQNTGQGRYGAFQWHLAIVRDRSYPTLSKGDS